MKNWGIKGKVLFLALAPAALIAAVLALHFVNSRIADLEQSLRERGLAISRQLAPASEYGVFAGNRDILQRLTDAALKEADINWVVITDINGDILATSGKPSRLPHVADAHAGLDFAVAETGSALTFSAPVRLSQIELDDVAGSLHGAIVTASEAPRVRSVGRVYVEMSRAGTVRRKNELIRNGLVIMLLGLAGSGLFAFRMSREVTRPIQRLCRAVRQIGAGNLDVRVAEDSAGELQVLEEGINNMATTLKMSRDNLQDKIAEATTRLSYQAAHDTLTGLPNRREFELRVERALTGAREQHQTHTLCYLDLDQFKVVNDTSGHVAGDELLRQLAVLLQGKLRDRDTLARLGGDEFGVLLENCNLEQAQPIAEVLRQMVKEFRFVWHDKPFMIGVSIGLVAITGESESLSALFSSADAACYAAKDRGRNRVHVYEEEDIELVRRRGEMQWVGRITRAMEENRLRLFVQPIVPLFPSPDADVHYEMLLRMLDDDGHMILPMAFIPAAERYNLMTSIDRWVISAAFSTFHQLFPVVTGGGKSICTVNLSGHTLCDEHFLDFVERQFSINHVPYESICFEITETAAITNLTEAIEFIRVLKAKGCKFSLDDFGSGLSSFTYLKNLPVDFLKIDGAFVKDMETDPMDRAMVESINHLGHVMGLKTIAEFVESEQIMEHLKAIQVDYVQGDWIKAPQPLSSLLAGKLP
ncbi:MAG: EAL domain-containing protein [Hydrogenophilales bacterium]|nr:EAL domain-containing protein [Hydrogenophilales bacterium]